jgi:hypothetical protein
MKNVMSLTPEEKFNQEVWWVLQEIKKEQLATPKGEKVYFSLRFLPKTSSIRRREVDYGFPPADTQRKILYKLKEWKTLDLEPSNLNFDDFLSPPTAYLLGIRQSQFDKLYCKYKEENTQEEFQDLPKNKGVINEEWTEQEVLEIVLLELSEAVSRRLNKNTCNVEITIAPLDKSIVNHKETALRKKVISFLKSQEIIQDYKLGRSNETIIFFNYLKNKNPEGKPIKMGVLTAECKVNPQKVIDYAVEIFEPKKLYCEKLAGLYTKLIDIVETYFTKPIIRDEKLNNFYTMLTENMKEMIDEDLIPPLKLKNWQPFTNLFYAEEEMKRRGVNLRETIQIMNAFLGEIYKFITIFDVKPKKESEKIKDLDDYLASIRSQKRKQKKEPVSSKIEITKIPELRIKKSEKLSESKKKQIKETDLYLNQNGDLYREPKERYCYPMGEKSNRHKIIRFLVMNNGYQFTEFISTELGIESEKTIRTEIGKMKNNIKKYLKIDGKDFLQGKKESGYRINPKYKITLKNE